MPERGFRALRRPGREPAAPGVARQCGGCTLCCTVLRVDELGKLGGEPCRYLDGAGAGCGIHPHRPRICRRYRCLWLQGAFDPEDRPDRIGAVLDLLSQGGTAHLAVREAQPGALERSPRLAAIVGRYRSFLPVHVSDTRRVMDPDARVRVLLPDGSEQHLEGERITVLREGRVVQRHRLPWAERLARRVVQRARAWRLRRMLRRAGR